MIVLHSNVVFYNINYFPSYHSSVCWNQSFALRSYTEVKAISAALTNDNSQ